MIEREILKAYADIRKHHPEHIHRPLYTSRPTDTSEVQEVLMRSGIAARYFGVTDNPEELEALANYCIIKGI